MTNETTESSSTLAGLVSEALSHCQYADYRYCEDAAELRGRLSCIDKLLKAATALSSGLSEEQVREIAQSKAMAQVCLDLHAALGVKWGDDPYSVINELKLRKQ